VYFGPSCVAAIAACEPPQNVAPAAIGIPQNGQKAMLNPFGVVANLSLAYNGSYGTTAGYATASVLTATIVNATPTS